MGRVAFGAGLGVLGLPLILVSVFVDAAGPERGEYPFGWEQKAGVVLGCTAIWLACVAASGWRPHHLATGRTVGALEAALAKVSEQDWFELSQTQAVRVLGALQALVVGATAVCLLVFTSARWYVALLAGTAVSIALNFALVRGNRSLLSRERRRRRR
jgi:hypothetical protein